MTSLAIDLPDEAGRLVPYALQGNPIEMPAGPHRFNRMAYAAVHVVADPFAAREPGLGPAIDWDATLALRRHILDLGLGVAEAMDTAQRGMGLDWPAARELIERSLAAAAPAERERIVSGVGTDHLDPAEARTLDDVVAGYLEQLAAVQKTGGRVVLMASRALARIATGPADYEAVYARVLAEADAPVILHWLGEMFDPALAGYWGATEFPPALETALAVIHANAARIDGIKLSLLDDRKEIEMRRRLPDGVRMYTGDDFNYPALIEGDASGSQRCAAGHLRSHRAGGVGGPLRAGRERPDRHTGAVAGADRSAVAPDLSGAPTQHYKTGVVFLAYLNGFQDHFVMVGGAQAIRPLPYFTDLFRLADTAGLLRDPEGAVARMRSFLRLYGVEA